MLLYVGGRRHKLHLSPIFDRHCVNYISKYDLSCCTHGGVTCRVRVGVVGLKLRLSKWLFCSVHFASLLALPISLDRLSLIQAMYKLR